MCARSVERLSLAAHTLLSIEFTLEGDWEVCRVGKVLLQQWLPHSMLRKKKKKRQKQPKSLTERSSTCTKSMPEYKCQAPEGPTCLLRSLVEF